MVPPYHRNSDSIELQSARFDYSKDDDDERPRKTWLQYLPQCFTVILLIAPHPSLLFVLVDYHLLTIHRPDLFALHIFVTYSLTFLIFSSMIVCMARDPGPVVLEMSEDRDGDEQGLTDALLSPTEDFTSPGKWCRQCWGPKPERTHHCTQCGRCVLKMDHHCVWLGGCIGHRTYGSFVHFLGCITLLSLYIVVVAILALRDAFMNPLSVNAVTPLHELGLAFTGIVFAFVIGTFFLYHLHLITTNQTTLESLSSFILLRELPQLDETSNTQGLSNPPLEQELTYLQRRLVRRAHGKIRLYDVGWYKNWAQVYGWDGHWVRILYRLWQGGAGKGDGKSFPRHPRAEEMLAQLAKELVMVDKTT